MGKEQTFALGLGAERGADAFPVIPLALDGTGLHPCEQPANLGVREVARACWRLEAPPGPIEMQDDESSHFRVWTMAKTKVAVTLDAQVLRRVDRLVREACHPNRSQAIEAAIASRLDRLECRRLIEACALLNPEEERLLAEEGLETDGAAWPEYQGARFAGPICIPLGAANRLVPVRF